MEDKNISNNIKNAQEDLRERNIFEITSDRKEVVLTSKGGDCYSSIIIKPRNKDLLIEINNLKMNAQEQIAIDFRGGRENNYKSILKFIGDNEIISEGNIAICVSNNQTVEIRGEASAKLNIISGKNMPVIGSNEYTEGAGHIVFSKEGSIYLQAGNYLKESLENIPWRGKDGAYGIGFYNEDNEKFSSIEILDNINLAVKAEDGESIKSISYENTAGNGGAAIKLKEGDLFKKESKGYLKLLGGNGGGCQGEYCCGKCGNGGAAIAIESGHIIIRSPAELIGGKGGSFKEEENYIMAKGGNGGAGILFYDIKEVEESNIKLGDAVEIIGGDGGNSSFYLNDTGITTIKGGNGGNCFQALKVKVKLLLEGEIKCIVGKGGKGSCEEKPCISGEDGREIVGDIIEVSDNVFEDTYENDKENIEIIYEQPTLVEDNKVVAESDDKTIEDEKVIYDIDSKEEDKQEELDSNKFEIIEGNNVDIENKTNKKDGLAVIYQEQQSSKSYNIFVRIIKKILSFFK